MAVAMALGALRALLPKIKAVGNVAKAPVKEEKKPKAPCCWILQGDSAETDARAAQQVGAGRSPGAKSRRERIRRCERIELLYQLGEQVSTRSGGGSQGRLARSIATGETVVIWTRSRRSFADDGEEREWRESMEFLLNLPRARHLTRVLEVRQGESEYHVVTEHAGGASLADGPRRGEPCPLAEVREVLRQLLAGVAALHARNCLHRGLRLESVIVEREAVPTAGPLVNGTSGRAGAVRVRLADFDAVEPLGSHSEGQRPRRAAGSDPYLAPEVYEGHYTRASDVFAVGVIAYALLTGRLPFGEDVLEAAPSSGLAGVPDGAAIQERISQAPVDWSHPSFAAEPLARDLVQRMLSVDRGSRPTARSAGMHMWLAGPGLDDAAPGGEASPQRSPLRLAACTP